MGQDTLKHIACIAALVALLVGGALLPFLPGPSIEGSVAFSWLCRSLGFLGVLLVPVGAVWYTNQRRRGGTSAKPLYFMLVAPLALPLQLLLVPGAVERSRDRAIASSAPLIADIERYREANGQYPMSLLALLPDYKTGVIGIERYQYERHGEAYNLVFENPARAFGTREVVVYNPRDEQVFTAHTRDVVQLSPSALALDRTRGHYAVHPASQPHWKYFWFD